MSLPQDYVSGYRILHIKQATHSELVITMSVNNQKIVNGGLSIKEIKYDHKT